MTMTLNIFSYINIIITNIFIKYSHFKFLKIENIVIIKYMIFKKYKNNINQSFFI